MVLELKETAASVPSLSDAQAAFDLAFAVGRAQGGERNAGQAREGLLQFEKDQLRARLAEIDELLRNARQLLDQARHGMCRHSAAQS